VENLSIARGEVKKADHHWLRGRKSKILRSEDSRITRKGVNKNTAAIIITPVPDQSAQQDRSQTPQDLTLDLLVAQVVLVALLTTEDLLLMLRQLQTQDRYSVQNQSQAPDHS